MVIGGADMRGHAGGTAGTSGALQPSPPRLSSITEQIKCALPASAVAVAEKKKKKKKTRADVSGGICEL